MTYAERARALIQDHYLYPWPPPSGCADARGVLPYCTAALWLGQNTEAANTKLASVQVSHLTGQNCSTTFDPARGDLWLGYLIRPYGLFSADSRHYPGRLTVDAEANLRTQMWLHAKTYSKVAHANGPWDIWDSENHDATTKSFNLLAAQTLKTSNPGLRYADGTTPAAQYTTWRDHWSAWFDERAKRGLLVEVGSPSYVGYTVAAILNIYNFAEDEVLRKKAEMWLDLLFADFALTCLAGVKGGAKSRSYPDASYDGRGDSLSTFAELLFATVPVARRNNHSLALATSGYQPPALVTALVTDPTRGAYEHVTRVPGIGPSGWDNRHWKVDPTKSIVNYTYVTSDFTMGTAMSPAGETHIGPSNQNRWQGVSFATGPDVRVYPQAANSSVTKTKDAFVSVQRLNTLITRKKTNLNNPTHIYFAPNLDLIEEQSGWLFVREGNAYLAVRPVVGTYAWMTADKNKAPIEANRFVRLSIAAAPIIFEAARALVPFTQFKAEILARPRAYVSGVTTYKNRIGTEFTFYDDKRTPLVNGVPISYAPTTTHKSPYLNENWNTGYVTLVKGTSRVAWDFRNRDAPVKTVV